VIVEFKFISQHTVQIATLLSEKSKNTHHVQIKVTAVMITVLEQDIVASFRLACFLDVGFSN
jgi:hypothetical protein